MIVLQFTLYCRSFVLLYLHQMVLEKLYCFVHEHEKKMILLSGIPCNVHTEWMDGW